MVKGQLAGVQSGLSTSRVCGLTAGGGGGDMW